MEKTWNINQFAKLTGISVHTLRYYEKIGLLRAVRRDARGYRLYSEQDLSWVQFLMRLKKTGMPISRMKRFSDLRSQGSPTISARRQLLEEHQAGVLEQLRELQDHLAAIEQKIVFYKNAEKEDNSE